MQSLKQVCIEVITNLPDSSSLEEIMSELNLTAQVLEGLSDEEKNKTITTADLLKRIESHETGISANIPQKKSLKTIQRKVNR